MALSCCVLCVVWGLQASSRVELAYLEHLAIDLQVIKPPMVQHSAAFSPTSASPPHVPSCFASCLPAVYCKCSMVKRVWTIQMKTHISSTWNNYTLSNDNGHRWIQCSYDATLDWSQMWRRNITTPPAAHMGWWTGQPESQLSNFRKIQTCKTPWKNTCIPEHIHVPVESSLFF